MPIHREFDIIIFGATGFTGKYVLKNLIISNQIEKKSWKVAIAGRNGLKLNSVIEEISNELKQNIKDVAIIIANLDDYSSLLKMCQRTRIIFNTVGPFILYGEPVIQACIEVRRCLLYHLCYSPHRLTWFFLFENALLKTRVSKVSAST